MRSFKTAITDVEVCIALSNVIDIQVKKKNIINIVADNYASAKVAFLHQSKLQISKNSCNMIDHYL